MTKAQLVEGAEWDGECPSVDAILLAKLTEQFQDKPLRDEMLLKILTRKLGGEML
ncbi:hypothetical protein CCR75_002184 [Bremia lactucae]|uniref:Uncharacterized protein n=1 Tax=Bremia lactucae TaxID=4779 RepID=A0A976FST0_BRELC|nr:hypothetical protein CCR75_002184 [Bremia lactucae]